jgi:hypothetical protein
LLALFEPSASFLSNKGNQSQREKKISIFTFIVIVVVAAVVVAAFMQIENLKFPTKKKFSQKYVLCYGLGCLTGQRRRVKWQQLKYVFQKFLFFGSNLSLSF